MANRAANSTLHAPRLSFRGLTFSIRQLLLGTAFVALACVALRSAGPWWVSATFALTVAALAVGVLLAVYRTGGERAFWTGFVLCGAVHLALVLYGWHLVASKDIGTNHPLKPIRNDHKLLTARLSTWSYDWLFPPRPAADPFGGSYGGMGGMPGMGGMSGGMPGGYGGGMGGGMGGGYDGGYDAGGYGDMGMGGYPAISETPGDGSGSSPAAAAPAFEPPARAHYLNVAHSLWTLLLASAGGWIALLIYTTGQRREPQEAGR
jgi:hypothetical protein